MATVPAHLPSFADRVEIADQVQAMVRDRADAKHPPGPGIDGAHHAFTLFLSSARSAGSVIE